MAMLAVSAQAATYSLYAVIDGTKMTLKASKTSISKATKYDPDTYWWTQSFSKTVTTAVIDATCKNYSGSSLDNLFYYCTKLESISGLSNLNTSGITSMEDMFFHCESLKSIDLSSFNTSNVTNMDGMFYYCRGLTSLDVSTFNTANVTDMADMFSGCSSLTSLDVRHFDTSKATDMAYMFSGCRSLTSIDVSQFNTANVTRMNLMFNYCTALTTLDLSAFNTENVTDMSDMFRNCSSMTSLDLSSFNTAQVTNMADMFDLCSKITSLDVKRFNTENVTNMNHMFASCRGLTSLDVSNFDTSNVTDMNNMFYDCSGFSALDLRSFNTAKVTNMSRMFYDDTNLAVIIVGAQWTTANVTTSDYMFNRCNAVLGERGTTYNSSYIDKTYARIDGGSDAPGYLCSTYPLYAMVSGDALTLKCGVVETGGQLYTTEEMWYASCADIATVVVDESCKNYTGASLQNLFNSFASLQSISGFEHLNTANATNMSNMFMYCYALDNLDLSSFDTSCVTDMSNMFSSCRKLAKLNLCGWDTRKVTDMRTMFETCTSLTTLNLSSFDTRSVKWTAHLFGDCRNLATIIVGYDWSTASVTNSLGMFYDCTSLVGNDGTTLGSTVDATKAHTGAGGYLTGLTRTLTANAANGKRWTTFYTDNVGYTIDGGEEACAYTATYNGGAGTLTLHKLGTDGRSIPAGTAVIVVASESNTQVGMTVDNTLGNFEGDNDLHGVDIDTPTSTILTNLGDGTLYVLGNKNAHFGFHQFEGATMAGRKAFLLVDSGVAQSRSLTMVFDDETTGINETVAKAEDAGSGWYTTDGRKLNAKPTAKGLYINNGRKTIVK